MIKNIKSYNCDLSRFISTHSIICKQIPNNLKGKNKSSQEWLTRQLKDPYIEKAKLNNYRCRSAFKLLEIDAKHKLFTHGSVVVDCGAAPGSWTQVAVKKTNSDGNVQNSPQGTVIGLDRNPIYPIEGATLLGGYDFTCDKSRNTLKEILNGKTSDIVLSDMAPNATGVKSMDHDAIINLAYLFIRFAIDINSKGGSILLKLFEGGTCQKVEKDLSRFYDQVKWVKPPSTRSDSSEVFLLGKSFKGVNR